MLILMATKLRNPRAASAARKRNSRSLTSYDAPLWGAVRKNIISDRFSTKTAISKCAQI